MLVEKVNVLVQLYVKGDIAWRYRIDNGLIELEKVVTVEKDCVKDVVNAMDWAVNAYPAQHYCFTLWNHGFGILDPQYNGNSNDWSAEEDEVDIGCAHGLCPLKYFDHYYALHKGTLFNHFDKSYMTNQMMIDALKQINQNILYGKKIDIFGTDCCKMAMVEVGYQVKDYVNYLIGSQNCELADGWNYNGIFNNVTSDMCAKEVVKEVVSSYSNYYNQKSKVGLYTLSALDLNVIDKVVDDINKISLLCKELIHINHEFKATIRKMRDNCVYICDASFYTDLDSFYSQILSWIHNNLKALKDNSIAQELLKSIEKAKDNLQKFVVANCTGNNITDAKGCSIYFPRFHIDSSYLNTVFSQDTAWTSFLDLFVSL